MTVPNIFANQSGPIPLSQLDDNFSSILTSLSDTSNTSNGDALIGVKSTLTGGISRTQHDKNTDRISVKDFGAVGDGGTDDTAAIQAAYTALGSGGVLYFPRGTYNFTALVFDGLLNITFRGDAGGEVGNTTPGSFAGATFLRHTGTSGIAISFAGSGYNSKQLTFEDIAVYTASDNYALKFDNCSQIHFNRVMVVSNGSNANSGGIYFSRCFYVFGDRLFVLKTANQRVSTCIGIRIDMGAAVSFLGGQYNFTNSLVDSFQAGITAGAATFSAANEGYANINWLNSTSQNNQVGITLQQGVKCANIHGGYNEANTDKGIFVTLGARGVSIKGVFFNNYSAGDSDVRFGVGGSGVEYQKFYASSVENCTLSAVKVAGVISSATTGASLTVKNNHFTLGTAGALGISSNIEAVRTGDNTFSGFVTANELSGKFLRIENDSSYIHNVDATKTVTVADYQVAATDPEILTVANTRAGAKLLGPVIATAKGWRGLVVAPAANTQNILIRDPGDTATRATLVPGAKAFVWNDGTTDYAGLLT